MLFNKLGKNKKCALWPLLVPEFGIERALMGSYQQP